MKRKKKAKKFNSKTRIVSAIRKIWLYSPNRREVVKRCKDGDNYRCERCKKLCDKIQIDHDPPAVPLEGWDGFDPFIQRMFVDPSIGLRGLCEICHNKITTQQRKIRKENKKNEKS